MTKDGRAVLRRDSTSMSTLAAAVAEIPPASRLEQHLYLKSTLPRVCVHHAGYENVQRCEHQRF